MKKREGSNRPAPTPAEIGAAAALALDFSTIDTVLDSLLGAHPPPHVVAASDQGIRVPMPPEVPVAAGHAIEHVGSALELCHPADLGAIVDAWQRARATRGAQVAVHVRNDPDRTVMLHFVDARHRYGVYLGIFVGIAGEDSAGIDRAAGRDSLFRPRLCTIERNELSVIVAVDDAITKILGWSADELIGLQTTKLTHPDDREDAIATWVAMLGRPGAEHRGLMRYRHKDGSYVWLDITYQNRLNDPAFGYVLTQMVDVSDRMAAVEALRANEQLLRRLTETLPLAIVQIDAARRIVYRNERVNEIPGGAGSTTFDELFAAVAGADRPLLEAALAATLANGEPADLEVTLETGGARRRSSVGMRALSAEDGTVSGAIACITDITERVRLRDELERRAKYDMLTHCQNRAAIMELLESTIRAERWAGGMAVLFFDLDRFKAVNDRYGHAAGDELLRRTGERLLHSVRAGDAVGRLGGDEFLVVCPDVPTPEVALEIAQRLATDLGAVVHWESVSLTPAASIGVAWTDAPATADDFVAAADAAMYESKRGDHAPVVRRAQGARIPGMT